MVRIKGSVELYNVTKDEIASYLDSKVNMRKTPCKSIKTGSIFIHYNQQGVDLDNFNSTASFIASTLISGTAVISFENKFLEGVSARDKLVTIMTELGKDQEHNRKVASNHRLKKLFTDMKKDIEQSQQSR